jgi:hypothetical protein
MKWLSPVILSRDREVAVKDRMPRCRLAMPVATLLMIAGCSGSGGENAPGSAAVEGDPGLWDEVERLYEQARATGEQVPGDVYDWLKEDLNHIGDWEYRVIAVSDLAETELETTMNELGLERWECFAVVRESDAVHLFFKRPVKSYLRHIPVTDLWKLVPGKGEGDGGE